MKKGCYNGDALQHLNILLRNITNNGNNNHLQLILKHKNGVNLKTKPKIN